VNASAWPPLAARRRDLTDSLHRLNAGAAGQELFLPWPGGAALPVPVALEGVEAAGAAWPLAVAFPPGVVFGPELPDGVVLLAGPWDVGGGDFGLLTVWPFPDGVCAFEPAGGAAWVVFPVAGLVFTGLVLTGGVWT
jgi:hypothetical protein